MKRLAVVIISLALSASCLADTYGENIKRIFVFSPRPQWPISATERHLYKAQGVFRLWIDPTGRVTGVQVIQSTGHRDVDEACHDGFMRWRAHRGSPSHVDVPITFRLLNT